MKLPWNRNYLIISFHIVITIIILCIVGGMIFQISEAKNVIFSMVGNFFTIFSPLFFGIFFAIILNPAINFFEKHISNYTENPLKSRRIATLTTLILIIGLIGFLGFFTGKSMGGANLDFAQQQLLSYIEKLGDFFVLVNVKMAQWGILHNVEGILSAWITGTISFLEGSLFKIGSAIPNMGNKFIDGFLGFVIAIYFSFEKVDIFKFCNEVSQAFLGERVTNNLQKAFATIYNIFIGYLGGQLIDAVIMAILFSITFYVIGLPYGVVLGIFSGFSNIIPYFGSIVAFILSVISAVLSGDTSKVLYAILSILILQQIDSIIIVPRVVGKKVEVHPVIVILSLTVFGRLFGFIGLVLAVPLGALCKTIFLWLYEKRKK